jgi:hypothetical protein
MQLNAKWRKYLVKLFQLALIIGSQYDFFVITIYSAFQQTKHLFLQSDEITDATFSKIKQLIHRARSNAAPSAVP